MGKIMVMEHPLIQHKIGIIRRTETSSKDFRELVSEIAMFMAYEATRGLKLRDIEIDTPITKTTVKELAGKKLAVVPILRAGLGMVEGMLTMIPAADWCVTRRHSSRWNTTASCLLTVKRGKFLLQILCWLRAAPQRQLSPC